MLRLLLGLEIYFLFRKQPSLYIQVYEYKGANKIANPFLSLYWAVIVLNDNSFMRLFSSVSRLGIHFMYFTSSTISYVVNNDACMSNCHHLHLPDNAPRAVYLNVRRDSHTPVGWTIWSQVYI